MTKAVIFSYYGYWALILALLVVAGIASWRSWSSQETAAEPEQADDTCFRHVVYTFFGVLAVALLVVWMRSR